jgi:solute carrier family 35, member F1/2
MTSQPPLSPVPSKNDGGDEVAIVPSISATEPSETEQTERPPIDYSSLSAFQRSLWERFRSLWTRRFVLSLISGQVVSLCITCTNVTTTECAASYCPVLHPITRLCQFLVVNRNWSLPTTQTLFL